MAGVVSTSGKNREINRRGVALPLGKKQEAHRQGMVAVPGKGPETSIKVFPPVQGKGLGINRQGAPRKAMAAVPPVPGGGRENKGKGENLSPGKKQEDSRKEKVVSPDRGHHRGEPRKGGQAPSWKGRGSETNRQEGQRKEVAMGPPVSEKGQKRGDSRKAMAAAPPVPGGGRENKGKGENLSPGKKQEDSRKEKVVSPDRGHHRGDSRKAMTAVPPGKGQGRFERTQEAAVASLKKVYGDYCLVSRKFAEMNPRPHRCPGGYWYPWEKQKLLAAWDTQEKQACELFRSGRGPGEEIGGSFLRVRGCVFGFESEKIFRIPIDKESGCGSLVRWARKRLLLEQMLVALRLYKGVKDHVLAEGSKDFRLFVFRVVFVDLLLERWFKDPEGYRRLRKRLRDPEAREAYFLQESIRLAADSSFFSDRRQRWDPKKFFGEPKV